MATFGVTPSGWLSKPLSQIESEIDADLQAILGASAGTEPDGTIPLASKAGQLKSMLVDREAALWDLMESVAASVDPGKATGASLDAIGSITGAIRDAAQFSKVTGTCTGTPLTLLQAGRVATVTDTGSRFDTLADATIAKLSAWASGTSYVVGNRVTNSNRAYQCITAGTSAGSGGPTTTAADITDNTAHWEFLGEGTGAVDVVFQAEASGSVGADAGALVNIATPVDGWKNVTNLSGASVGNALESDSAFRARRDQELSSTGNTTADAIRANILAVNAGSTDTNHTPPTACKVFFNDTDSVDANGLPPHSVEVLAQNGTDADIALAVWNSVGAGTATFGNQTSTVTDSEGNSQTVKWSRPVDVNIYVVANGRYDASQWPAGSDALVAQTMLSALLTFTGTGLDSTAKFPIGLDVRTSPLNGAFMRGPAQTKEDGTANTNADPAAPPVPGLLEVDTLFIGTSPAPSTSTPVSIGVREIAIFDATRCTITAAVETP